MRAHVEFLVPKHGFQWGKWTTWTNKNSITVRTTTYYIYFLGRFDVEVFNQFYRAKEHFLRAEHPLFCLAKAFTERVECTSSRSNDQRQAIRINIVNPAQKKDRWGAEGKRRWRRGDFWTQLIWENTCFSTRAGSSPPWVIDTFQVYGCPSYSTKLSSQDKRIALNLKPYLQKWEKINGSFKVFWRWLPGKEDMPLYMSLHTSWFGTAGTNENISFESRGNLRNLHLK